MKLANIIKDNKTISESEWLSYIDSLMSKKENYDFKKVFVEAIKERIPKTKFGILFSGGIDSTLIAFICKKLKADFTCYTVGLKDSPDIISAEQTAKKYNFKLKKKILNLKEIEKTIKIVAKLVGPDTMKVGVGSVIYEGIKLAKKDNINYIFSGLGSEEIFAGYERHAISKDINKECWFGLKTMYQRDFLRDLAIAKELKVSVLTPFLDNKVILSAMAIPGKEKIVGEHKKYALRKAAEELGLEDAWRKKQAAQYGSYFDKAIAKLAKKNNFNNKKDYLSSFLKQSLGVLFSSGKDSAYAMYLLKQQGYPIKCLINIYPENEFSYMYHKASKQIINLQSEALDIPLIQIETRGEKEKELKELEEALKTAKKKYNIRGIVTGALYSVYQKERVEKICKELRLECFSPLWHIDQEKELRELINNKFSFILVKIAAEGLNKSWLNKEITDKDIDNLILLNKKIGLNIAFEGGEAESLVLDCPMFKKRINILKSAIKEEGKNNAELIIEKAELIKKNI